MSSLFNSRDVNYTYFHCCIYGNITYKLYYLSISFKCLIKYANSPVNTLKFLLLIFVNGKLMHSAKHQILWFTLPLIWTQHILSAIQQKALVNIIKDEQRLILIKMLPVLGEIYRISYGCWRSVWSNLYTSIMDLPWSIQYVSWWP